MASRPCEPRSPSAVSSITTDRWLAAARPDLLLHLSGMNVVLQLAVAVIAVATVDEPGVAALIGHLLRREFRMGDAISRRHNCYREESPRRLLEDGERPAAAVEEWRSRGWRRWHLGNGEMARRGQRAIARHLLAKVLKPFAEARLRAI